MQDQVDRVVPNGRWSFNDEVTRAFDDMLCRSIPQYEVMRKACFDIACSYVRPHTVVLDLGCSRGEALAPLVHRFGTVNRFVGLEVSKPMLAAARQRFQNWIDAGVVEITEWDLRSGLPTLQASVTLSILTLQFVPIEHRQRLVRDIYKRLLPGGAFVLVEKVLGATAELDAQMVDNYYALKAANDYTPKEIERKRLALEGVLVPVTARWNEEFLHMAGFLQVDCIWRWMNFAAWVAVKDTAGS